jgi:hypothetical protein
MSLVQIQYGPPFSNVCLTVGAKREPTGSQKHREPAALTAGMSFSEGHDRAFMSAVTHRQLPQGDRPLLTLDGLHILFSQVNRDLRNMFPDSRELNPSYGQRFMVAGGVTGRVSKKALPLPRSGHRRR